MASAWKALMLPLHQWCSYVYFYISNIIYYSMLCYTDTIDLKPLVACVFIKIVVHHIEIISYHTVLHTAPTYYINARWGEYFAPID